MGGDALQIAAAHTAMAAMAYLSNIKSGFLTEKPTQMAGASLGLGSRLEAGPATRSGIYVTEGLGSPPASSAYCQDGCAVTGVACLVPCSAEANTSPIASSTV
jgi:hypothetical protein